jgi:hypothetical protein
MLASISRPLLARQLYLSSAIRTNVRSVATTRFDSKKTQEKNNEAAEIGKIRKLHNTSQAKADATDIVLEKETQDSGLFRRFYITAEVTVSKIFPAGFGWQTASIYADKLGFADDSMAFAYTTGAGDGLAVMGGHTLYYAVKKAVTGKNINMMKEFQTGVWLGSAAFCSGTVWQPLVNLLQGANLSFSQVFLGTWIGCGSAFYVGLRAGRTLLSGPLEHIEEPTYENSKADGSLSVAIGGATGFFVGTDAAYLPDQNFLIDLVGITDGTPDLTGCAIAGTSTSMGFCATQSVMNVLYPPKKCWND